MTIQELTEHKFFKSLKEKFNKKYPDIKITVRLVPDSKHPVYKIKGRSESFKNAYGEGFDILFNNTSINFYLYEEVVLSTDDSKDEFKEMLDLCLEELPNRVKKYGIQSDFL